MRTSRVVWSCCIGLAPASAVLFVPLPHRVFGPLEMQPFDPASLYVNVPGIVVEAESDYGSTVAAGTVVARLENLDVELAVEALTARRNRQRAKLPSLWREQFDSPSATLSIPRAEKQLESLENQLQENKRDQARLTLAAPRGGTLFAPADVPASVADDHLPGWTGRPLDPINRGCAVDVGQLLGVIGDPYAWQAMILIAQEDVEFVQVGGEAEVLLDAFPGREFRGRVDEIAIGEMRETTQRMSSKAGGELATKSESPAAERPLSTSYHVRIRIDDLAGEMRVGRHGTARIQVADASLGMRLFRQLGRTFHFHL